MIRHFDATSSKNHTFWQEHVCFYFLFKSFIIFP